MKNIASPCVRPFPTRACSAASISILARIEFYDGQLAKLEVVSQATPPKHWTRRSVILTEIDSWRSAISCPWSSSMKSTTSPAFPRVQDFVSYCRLVKCQRESAGKIHGTGGAKIGNPYLRWAFGEAAALFLRGNPDAQRWLEKKTRKHNKAKALTILAHKLGRAVYYMLQREKPV